MAQFISTDVLCLSDSASAQQARFAPRRKRGGVEMSKMPIEKRLFRGALFDVKTL